MKERDMGRIKGCKKYLEDHATVGAQRRRGKRENNKKIDR